MCPRDQLLDANSLKIVLWGSISGAFFAMLHKKKKRLHTETYNDIANLKSPWNGSVIKLQTFVWYKSQDSSLFSNFSNVSLREIINSNAVESGSGSTFSNIQ